MMTRKDLNNVNKAWNNIFQLANKNINQIIMADIEPIIKYSLVRSR